MKKQTWVIMLVIVAAVLAGSAIWARSALAADEPGASNNSTFQDMYQACQTGDYNTMLKLHQQYFGDNTTGYDMDDMMKGMMGENWTGGMMDGATENGGCGGAGGGMMGGTNGGGMMGGNNGGMMGGTSGGGMMGGWFR